MDLDNIKKFVENTNSFLNKIPNKIIKDYIIDDFELPLYFKLEIDYDKLNHIYRETNSNIIISKEYAVDETRAENIINDLIILRRLVENIIKSHPKNRSRFEKENDKFKIEERLKPTYVQIKSHKLATLKKVYNLVISEKRLQKNSIQRKTFISLFFINKTTKEPLLWNGFDSDLRAFLSALIELKLITYNESDLTKFACANFKSKKRDGTISTINPDSFRSYQDKEPFQNYKDKWVNLLNMQLR